ncbi:MAG: hypothetical protein EXX96DRAFT_555494 [Benjaminiella poitrasii]|nr:MAG: hypothetical protein EXX96DRAFT_555494 [Benjaminiella poitrasii]
MFKDINQSYYEEHDSLQNRIPNSRIVCFPPPTPPEHNMNTDTSGRQPARTSSLQQQQQQLYHERESLVDPSRNKLYNTREETSLLEPSMSKLTIDSYFYPKHTNEALSYYNPEIQTVQPPKLVKSNLHHINDTLPSVQVHHVYLEPPQPSVAVVEEINPQDSAIRPPLTKSNPSAKLPKPPLTPLVIPPTPIRSSPSSPHTITTTPTRTSSRQQLYTPSSLTPGGLSTPGSCRSAYSPLPTGLSPFTPTQNTLYPSSPFHDTKTTSSKKKQSMQPESEAERLVHQGIKFHEAGHLEEATSMFKRATMMDLPIAMFLYGVSLRHGWGCKKNEHLAFQYLQKAAEHAVEDLSHFSNTVSTSAAKGELIMAIYELGVSFLHGWGCKKNKETAVYYFKIAADLNDPDAQNDLGHCYYHGHGVKKDLYLAAKYYRMADKQGQGIMGNSWIWKPKYDKLAQK